MPYVNRFEGKRPRTYPSGSNSEKLTEQALALAAQGDWAQAARANRELLSSHPRDIRSLNRMGKCLTELGEYQAATAAYARTLELDEQNDIARKNLRRLTSLSEKTLAGASAPVVTQRGSVVEAGTSAVAVLREPIDHETLAKFTPGTVLALNAEAGRLRVVDPQGRPVGALDPQLAQRLLEQIRGGSTYSLALISVADDNVRVVIRETYRHPDQANRASFVVRSDQKAAYDPTSTSPRATLDEDQDDGEASEADSPIIVAPTGSEYPEAELNEAELSPFDNEAIRV